MSETFGSGAGLAVLGTLPDSSGFRFYFHSAPQDFSLHDLVRQPAWSHKGPGYERAKRASFPGECAGLGEKGPIIHDSGEVRLHERFAAGFHRAGIPLETN